MTKQNIKLNRQDDAKDLYFIVGLLIGLILFSALLFLHTERKKDSNNFIITKQECLNKVIAIISLDFSEFNMTTFSEDKMLHLKFINNGTDMIIIDVECKIEEVDEILVDVYPTTEEERYCKKISEQAESIESQRGYYKECYNSFFKKDNIRKQDITKEWLVDNCERLGQKEEILEDTGWNNGGIKYKCGEYEVELK